MNENRWKVEIRTNRYVGSGADKIIRTDFFYSAQQPIVCYPSTQNGLIDIEMGDERILVRAYDVELLHVAEITESQRQAHREVLAHV
jgi:hypothetical protein